MALGAVAFVAGGFIAPVWLYLGGRAPAISGRPGKVGTAAAALIVLANWAWLALSGV